MDEVIFVAELFVAEGHFLVHEGGTKFYETVLIKKLGFANSALLIKRYGPVAKRNGSGALIFANGSFGFATHGRDAIVSQKCKQGYSRIADMHGIHGTSYGNLIADQANFEGLLTKHYLVGLPLVLQQFRTIFGLPVSNAAYARPATSLVIENPLESVIIRTASWGSW